jgi:hypothetical protein
VATWRRQGQISQATISQDIVKLLQTGTKIGACMRPLWTLHPVQPPEICGQGTLEELPGLLPHTTVRNRKLLTFQGSVF